MQLLGSKSIPRLHEIRINGGVLLFTLALSLISAMLFGLAPALRAAQPRPADGTEGRPRRGGRAVDVLARRPRSARARLLVVAELMLSVMLLVGAGLLIRSFARLQRRAAGIQRRTAC